MNRIKATVGITALVIASLGFTAPSQANPTTPSSVVSFETPEAALSFEEVQVTTLPAPEPTPTPVVEPAPEQEAIVPKPNTVPEPSVTPSVPPAAQVQAPSSVPAQASEETPEPTVPTPSPGPSENAGDHPADQALEQGYFQMTEDPNSPRLWWNQGDTVESYELYRVDLAEFSEAEQQQIFTENFLGTYVAEYPPTDCIVITSVENPDKVYAFKHR